MITSIQDRLNQAQNYFTDKIRSNMLYPGNKYGVLVAHMFYDTVVKYTQKRLNNDGCDKFLVSYENGEDGKKVMVTCKRSTFDRFFKESYKFDQFVADLMTLRKECLELKIETDSHVSDAGHILDSVKDNRISIQDTKRSTVQHT